jgi:hypothetical protein
MTRPTLALIIVLVSLTTTQAGANPKMVAMIVGVNTSVDSSLPSLRYADDDAVLYRQLFRQLGATTFLLTRLDDNTRRLHSEAAEDALPPRRAALRRAISEAAAAVAAARASGDRTVFYFVYAGHGNVRDGQGYIGLEDDRLTGMDLEQWVLNAVAADQMHVIIDACYSGLLAGTRGPGGERRPLQGFSQFHGLASNDRIGLLLSTSSARESHEWAGFQAGVFSYEVRSGMYGAADVDSDGSVSYREIAAFVTRANAAILNERFRPDVYARPPRGTDRFLDLRDALHRRIEIDGKRPGHYVLEDELGVRVLDFHNAPDQRVVIIRSSERNDLFLRRIDDNHEYRVVADAKDVLTLEDLDVNSPRVTLRGAAHEAFSRTFLLPFDMDVVHRFDALLWEEGASVQGEGERGWRRSAATRVGWRRPATVIALGVGGSASLAAVAFTLSARGLHRGVTPRESQASVAARNAKIEFRTSAAEICGGVAVAAIITGTVFLLWPRANPSRRPVLGAILPTTGGTLLTIGAAF